MYHSLQQNAAPGSLTMLPLCSHMTFSQWDAEYATQDDLIKFRDLVFYINSFSLVSSFDFFLFYYYHQLSHIIMTSRLFLPKVVSAVPIVPANSFYLLFQATHSLSSHITKLSTAILSLLGPILSYHTLHVLVAYSAWTALLSPCAAYMHS